MIDARYVFSVSQLNRETRLLLNEHFGLAWVQGEISNLAVPTSGHFYFSLRDEAAQVRCAMFRSQNRILTFQPQNGDQVLVRAQVSLYEPRGDYQLVVDYMEQAGDGALRRAFEILKQRLAAEGLFDPAHKKAIPTLPRCIGVITSPTGAAIHDILTVLHRRFRTIPVIVFPTKVQGPEAKWEIVAALQEADRSKLCDVLILARGGGSLEDLWAFNEEMVARAIHSCRIPVVTAIGHEVDFTIADLVADLRTPTPSAAAETVSPDAQDWVAQFQRREKELAQRLRELLRTRSQRLGFIEKRLEQAHPRRRLQTQLQRVDELELRLRRSLAVGLGHREGRLATQLHRLLRHHPDTQLRALETRRQESEKQLRRGLKRRVERERARLVSVSDRLNAVGPLATLARGYAVVTRARDGSLVRSVADVGGGERTQTRLADGSITAVVERTQSEG